MCDCEPKPEVVSLIVKNERERIADAIEAAAQTGQWSEHATLVMGFIAKRLREDRF